MKKSRDRRSSPPPRQSAPQVMTLTVEDLSRSGPGVAKDAQGRVVFVPFTAPGDVVRLKIVNQTSKYAEAELLQVIEPSATRQTPPCPVFGRCGGCDWQHIDYALQWRTKSEGVKLALSRAQLPQPDAWEEYPARQIYAYRNRIQLHGKKLELGFYAKGSHTIVPIERCAIAREELNRHIGIVREQAKSRNKPYKVELELLADGAVRAGWDEAAASGGFQQINSEQNRHLQDWVIQNFTRDRPVLDLYGGSANLSLRLAPLARRIDCVDLTVPEHGQTQWPENLAFHRRDVFAWVGEQARRSAAGAPPCSAIIDPPRGGMPEQLPQFIAALERLNVTELIAVGCKTDPWARDIAGFVEQGWRLEKVAVFDFFPQTAHVESAALLVR